MRQPSPADPAPAAPLVSVGMPVFNVGGWLRKAIDSVLAQDYPNVELVISDNASSDDTAAICREYAGDPRVRYSRNAVNVGAMANFGRVLQLARGKYFTWLAGDDALSHPEYLAASVAFLERHPDVVLCGCAINHLDYDEPGSSSAQFFPEVHPDRPWEEARRELFRWPFPAVAYVFYGVYRREALLKVPLALETGLLMPLSAHGRVVALPQVMRSYRHNPQSEGARIRRSASLLWVVAQGLWMRLFILKTALALPLPLRERRGPILQALRNLADLTYRWPTDTRTQVARLRRERDILLQARRERRALVERLRADAEKRPYLPPGGEAAPGGAEGAARSAARGLRDWLTRVFLHSPRREQEEFLALQQEVAALRQQCAELLAQINELHDGLQQPAERPPR